MKSETAPQHNFLIRYIKLWVETIQYIRLHGWAEYRKARERYDKHQNAIQNIESRYSKVREIKRANQLMKMRK